MPRLGPRSPAEARARELLVSLLTPRQVHRLEATGTWWVFTPLAWIRLGILYDIRVRTRRAPSVERSTCVVTEGFALRPLDDMWCELVAWLAIDPTSFLRVGNPQPCRDRVKVPTLQRDLESWLGCQRQRWRSLRDTGLETESAHLAYEVSVALLRSGRPHWAEPYAQKAADQIEAEAWLFPSDATDFLDEHRPILRLAEELRGSAEQRRLAPDQTHPGS